MAPTDEVPAISEQDGTNSTTTYSYDVGGRLKQVSQSAKDASLTPRTQNRFFTYDNRGFLTSESPPEKTSSVTYSGYDARGHVGRVIEARTTSPSPGTVPSA